MALLTEIVNVPPELLVALKYDTNYACVTNCVTKH